MKRVLITGATLLIVLLSGCQAASEEASTSPSDRGQGHSETIGEKKETENKLEAEGWEEPILDLSKYEREPEQWVNRY